MNKSLILRKAIDYIKHLEKNSNRLRQENLNLKLQLKQAGIDVFKLHQSPLSPEIPIGNLTPPRSGPPSIERDDISIPSSPETDKEVNIHSNTKKLKFKLYRVFSYK